MKTTSLKTIYLTADELKQAIVEYLAKEHEELAQHLYDNECDMVWGQDGKEFLVSIDGEVEDKEGKSLPWYGKCAHCFGGYVDQECTCKPDVSKMETTAICDACGKKCDGTEKKTITTKQLSGVVMCEECNGGNTTERVEEQAARLEKIAEQKEINKVVDQVESAAIKAVHKVMEQHSKTLDDHTPECKWHKDWHACDCGAFDK